MKTDTKLIDKSALIAEIERRVKAIRKAFSEQGILEGVDRTYANAQYDAFKSLLTFLDTIEVKEVDLDSEVERYIEQHKSELPGYFDMRRIARHFFELGLKAKRE